MLEAQPLELVRTIRESALQSGTSVDVETIPALQQYLGIRAPKEEKKDPKKKWFLYLKYHQLIRNDWSNY